MALGVEFILRATTDGFTAGVAAANNSIKGLKDELKKAGGASLVQAIGVAGIVRGFSEIYQSAQKTREEAEKLGLPIDRFTASVASAGDGFDRLKTAIGEVAVKSLGYVTQAGEGFGMLINLARGYSVEQQRELDKVAKIQKENDEQMLARRKDFMEQTDPAKLAAAEEKLAETRRKNEQAQMEASDRINALEEDRLALMAKIEASNKNTVASKELQIELSNKEKEIFDAKAKSQKAAEEAGAALAKEMLGWSKENAEQQEKLAEVEKKRAEYAHSKLPLEKQAEDYSKAILEITTQLKDKEMSVSDQILKQNQLLELQKGLDGINADIVAKKLEDEKKITDEKEKQAKKAELIRKINSNPNGNGSGSAFGGMIDVSDASDAALREIVRKSREEIKALEDSKIHAPGPSVLSGHYGTSLTIGQISMRSLAAQMELDTRNGIRGNLAFGGEDYARRMFDGDPRAFDALLRQITSGDGGLSEKGKVGQAIINLDRKLPDLNKR